MRRHFVIELVGLGSVLGLGLLLFGQSLPNTSHRAIVNKSCVDCHNRTDRAADLALDVLDPDHVAGNVEIWEKVVKRMLATGAKVDAPLVGAPLRTVDQAIEAVRLCMTSGGDLRAVDSDGKTALHVAAAKGSPPMIEFLADAGVPLDANDTRGRTALDLALAAKQPDERTIATLRRLASAE